MTIDEGMAVRNGERLNIQCLTQEHKAKLITGKFHYHKYAELLYFIKGSVVVHAGEDKVLCNAGDLCIIYSNEPHSFEHLQADFYYVIKFLPDILRVAEQTSKEFEYIFNFNMNKHSRVIKNADKIFGNLFADAYEKFAEDKYSNELFVRADLIRICAEIISFWYKNNEINSISTITSHENLVAIQKVIEYAKSTNGLIKTSEAAQMCNMSDGHFSRTFKSVMNMTFTEYVKSVKIAEAERLLKCTYETVTEIAQMLNYASTSHFIEDFRKEKGVSPKQYKKITSAM